MRCQRCGRRVTIGSDGMCATCFNTQREDAMKVGGYEIAHEPGQSYEDAEQFETEEEAREHRAEQRQVAVDEFLKAARRDTQGKLHEVCNVVIAMGIQLRALGGTAAGTGLGAKLREAADFLEDL